MTTTNISISATPRAACLRADLLTLGGLFIGCWITALPLKVAGKAIHFVVLLGAGLIHRPRSI